MTLVGGKRPHKVNVTLARDINKATEDQNSKCLLGSTQGSCKILQLRKNCNDDLVHLSVDLLVE